MSVTTGNKNSAVMWCIAMICIATANVGTVSGQTPPVPAGAQPGQIDRQLKRLPEPLSQPGPAAVVTPQLGEQLPANAAQIIFTVSRVEIIGNTRLSSDELLTPHKAIFGKVVSLAAVYAMAEEMTARYRNAGYILSSVRVPPQTIADGVVKLEVVEGYLADVRIEGSGVRSDLFEKGKQKLLAQRPLTSKALERFLLLFNDLPGLTAQGVLSPSSKTPGASDLVVKLEQSHGDVGLGGSNRGSSYQGPNQYQASLNLNSIFGLNESTSFQYLQAQKAEELKFYSISHTERLAASGLDLKLAGSQSKGNPNLRSALGGFPLETDAKQARVELSYPFLRTRANNVRVRAALSYHDGQSNILGQQLNADTISAAQAGLTWDSSDTAAGVNVVDFEYSKGLSIFGASKLGDPDASRLGGNPQFSKITFYAARLQSLSHGFSLLAALTGQHAFDNLLASEEFAFGGDQFGRAYDPSELVGDSGIAGKVEFRYTQETSVGVNFTVYGFGDKGRVERIFDPADTQGLKSESATAVGAGLRFGFRNWFTGYVEGARPTDRVLSASGKKETRVFAGLQLTYFF